MKGLHLDVGSLTSHREMLVIAFHAEIPQCRRRYPGSGKGWRPANDDPTLAVKGHYLSWQLRGELLGKYRASGAD